MIREGTLDANKPIITTGQSAGPGPANARNSGGPGPTLTVSGKMRVILPSDTNATSLKGAQVVELTPAMMRRYMGLSDDYLLPDSYTLAKTILGNGVHGNVTKNFIQPLVDQTVAGRQAVTDVPDLIAPSQAPSPGTGGIPGIEGGR